MAERADITAARVRAILDYNPETGLFRWKRRPVDDFVNERACKIWNTRFAGSVAGSMRADGYIHIHIDYKLYMAHRLAWLYVLGEWPHDEIDHADCIRSNNTFSNIRAATSTQNKANRSVSSVSVSKLKGAMWDNRRKKWRSEIRLDSKQKHIGYFDCPAAAHFYYIVEADKQYGEFARFV
jgi:hypothetical protein